MATTNSTRGADSVLAPFFPASLKGRVVSMYALLIGVNAGAWLWALIAFHHYPVLLGTALLAYTFGLRHAVDADHIAAIDNVTRKLMQQGKRPVAVGFFFSLGHSTIVFRFVGRHRPDFRCDQGPVQFLSSHRRNDRNWRFRFLSAGHRLRQHHHPHLGLSAPFNMSNAAAEFVDEDLNLILAKRGFFGRIFRNLFRLIEHSWQMYPVGFLFGLGFDTATEVGLLGISATEATKGLPIWSILVFPTLVHGRHGVD